MLTVAYCRVSTEEQAEEGFSIDGQADKLRVYAELHDLGDVMVIADPGLSGKDLNRQGLQRLLGMVTNGHVGHVLVWRLDRLSRNLGDLIALADTFGQTMSPCTRSRSGLTCPRPPDACSTTCSGRSISSTGSSWQRTSAWACTRPFARAAGSTGPKTGYDMRDGVLVPNDQAPLVREIFRLRAEGLSHQAIEDRKGGQVLDGPPNPAVPGLSRRSALQRRVVPGNAPTADHGRGVPRRAPGIRARSSAPQSRSVVGSRSLRALSSAGCCRVPPERRAGLSVQAPGQGLLAPVVRKPGKRRRRGSWMTSRKSLRRSPRSWRRWT
jgi:hypothetical protein